MHRSSQANEIELAGWFCFCSVAQQEFDPLFVSANFPTQQFALFVMETRNCLDSTDITVKAIAEKLTLDSDQNLHSYTAPNVGLPERVIEREKDAIGK